MIGLALADRGQAATMAAGIALAAVGAGAAVLAVKAAKVVNQVRAVASGAKTITNVGRTARGAINAGKVVSNTLGKAGRSVKAAGSAAKKWIANGNNFVRVGRVNANRRSGYQSDHTSSTGKGWGSSGGR